MKDSLMVESLSKKSNVPLSKFFTNKLDPFTPPNPPGPPPKPVPTKKKFPWATIIIILMLLIIFGVAFAIYKKYQNSDELIYMKDQGKDVLNDEQEDSKQDLDSSVLSDDSRF